ncbi:DMT family transporter [Staphylococcus delphini]|uniref:EamA family transporter n=1 Tax=Staphylococcus delphini TaxID=53344 RepID=A0AAX0QRX0_9STAP|nr:DMT family transporter [Staphylococcus delphini]PCF34019.1 EamA family transporter [Staphylococcus delphini]PCF46423.1 EamA family transporter [Staphylococcus delphini]PNZ95256.1 EamA family transporter [Staphylococcus delphini]RIZ49304.1 EamA family transporter [Staphylococcus delphini]VED63945.1 drug/metabolite transporter permease [Staphylococcus delphini]
MNAAMYIFCMLIWGLNFIAVKIQGESVSLEVALLYRSMIALVLFSVLLWVLRQRIALNNVNWLTVIGFGLCNFTVSYLLLYYGTFYSTAAIVTLIFSMKSILTPVLISIVFKKAIAPKIYIGGFLGILSVMVILYPDLNHLSSQFITGIVMAIFGTIITSVGDVLSLFNSNRGTHPVLANTFGMAGAVLFLLFYTLIQGQHYTVPTDVNFWIGLLYLSVLASFLAWLFYLKLIQNIGASESSYMVAMFPAIGGIASVLLGESQLSMSLVLGIVLACFGAYLALRKKDVSNAYQH